MLKEQLLKNFPTFIRTLIVNYTTKKHSVRCNYLFSSIKGVFTQSHEEDYNKGVITKSLKIALFGDLPNIITTSSQLMNNNIRKQITSNKLHAANQYATAKKMPF